MHRVQTVRYAATTCYACKQLLPANLQLQHSLYAGDHGQWPSSPQTWSNFAFPGLPTPNDGAFESLLEFQDMLSVLDSPLDILPPDSPIYLPAECLAPNWAINDGWSQHQLHQLHRLPSPPSTPLLLPSQHSASQDLMLSPFLEPMSPASTSTSLSPFGCQPNQTLPQTPPPSLPPTPGKYGEELHLPEIKQTEEGCELYARLCRMGLTASEIRIVWKRLHKVIWAKVADEESAIDEPVTPGALSMRLQRLKANIPYLRRLFPPQIRASNRRVKSPTTNRLSGKTQRSKIRRSKTQGKWRKQRALAEDTIYVCTD